MRKKGIFVTADKLLYKTHDVLPKAKLTPKHERARVNS